MVLTWFVPFLFFFVAAAWESSIRHLSWIPWVAIDFFFDVNPLVKRPSSTIVLTVHLYRWPITKVKEDAFTPLPWLTCNPQTRRNSSVICVARVARPEPAEKLASALLFAPDQLSILRTELLLQLPMRRPRQLYVPGQTLLLADESERIFVGYTLADDIIVTGIGPTSQEVLNVARVSLARPIPSELIPKAIDMLVAEPILSRVYDQLWKKLWSQTLHGFPTAELLIHLYAKCGYPLLIVGGTPRDLIKEARDRADDSESKDIDLVVAAPYRSLERSIADFLLKKGIAQSFLRSGPTEQQFGQLKLIGGQRDDQDLDISLFKAGKDENGQYHFGFSVLSDSQSRDLTYNALYIDPFHGYLYDPTSRGLQDAKENVAHMAHEKSFSTDYGGQLRRWLKTSGFTEVTADGSANEASCDKKIQSMLIKSLESSDFKVQLQLLTKMYSKLFKGTDFTWEHHQKFKGFGMWSEIVGFMASLDVTKVLVDEKGALPSSNALPLLQLIDYARELSLQPKL